MNKEIQRYSADSDGDFECDDGEYVLYNDYEEIFLKIQEVKRMLCFDNQTLLLHLGEMTAQELRTVKAAFNWVRANLK